MKPCVVFLSSALAVLTTAATLAPDLPDGVYHTYTDERGLEFHTQLSQAIKDDNIPLRSWTHEPHSPNSTAISPAFNPMLSKRDKSDCGDTGVGFTWCGCSFPVNHNDCDQAVADLKNQVGPAGIVPAVGHAYYSIRGSVVAFECASTKTEVGKSLTIQGITNAAGWITNKCGWYIAGTFYPYSGGLTVEGYGVGYMQYTSGLDFCANAIASSQWCC